MPPSSSVVAMANVAPITHFFIFDKNACLDTMSLRFLNEDHRSIYQLLPIDKFFTV